VSVRAYYVARGIEIIKMHSTNLYPSARKEFQRKAVTIYVNENLNQYISIFNYGSVVLFNIPEEDHTHHLRQIKSLTVFPIAEVLQHDEDYKLIVNENLQTPSVFHLENLHIKSLDSNNITIVSIIMAQTVALDYYAANVDQMIDKFIQINHAIQETGNFTGLKEKELYKLVASNNTIFTNVLSKLGFFEGTDVAWENAEYDNTWEELRKEFELDARYKDLSLKINIINEDARFFLAVLHHRKSTVLEWMIVVLIAGEMAIGLAGLGLQVMK